MLKVESGEAIILSSTWGVRSFYNSSPNPIFIDSDGNILDQELSLEDDFQRQIDELYKPKACECGSDKAETTNHSTWCPKYDNS